MADLHGPHPMASQLQLSEANDAESEGSAAAELSVLHGAPPGCAAAMDFRVNIKTELRKVHAALLISASISLWIT